MMLRVSSSGSAWVSSTGGPTVAVTTGGSVTLRRGSRELRGQTVSVPHRPTGITGTGQGGQPGRAPTTLQHRVEEGETTRNGAFGDDRHDVAGL